jgi:phosphohistidine phosphatase SixA
MATTTRHNAQPISYYWNLVKDMGDSQKLELVTMLIDSVKPVVEKTEVAEDEEYSLRPFTVEELNARIDQAEAQIAAGLVVSHEDMMREWEEELAREEQEALEMSKVV